MRPVFLVGRPPDVAGGAGSVVRGATALLAGPTLRGLLGLAGWLRWLGPLPGPLGARVLVRAAGRPDSRPRPPTRGLRYPFGHLAVPSLLLFLFLVAPVARSRLLLVPSLFLLLRPLLGTHVRLRSPAGCSLGTPACSLPVLLDPSPWMLCVRWFLMPSPLSAPPSCLALGSFMFCSAVPLVSTGPLVSHLSPWMFVSICLQRHHPPGTT